MTEPKTSIASYTASGSLILFGLTANDFAVLSGLFFAFITFCINWYYKHKHMRIIEQQVKRMPFPKLEIDEQ